MLAKFFTYIKRSDFRYIIQIHNLEKFYIMWLPWENFNYSKKGRLTKATAEMKAYTEQTMKLE